MVKFHIGAESADRQFVSCSNLCVNIYKMDMDKYYVDGVDGFFEENEENIENTTIQQELLAIVKANPVLWDKK